MNNLTQKNVVVVIGAGSIGQAIARRVSAEKHIVLRICGRKTRKPQQRL